MPSMYATLSATGRTLIWDCPLVESHGGLSIISSFRSSCDQARLSWQIFHAVLLSGHVLRYSQLFLGNTGLRRDARELGLGETGWLANGTQLQTRQPPLPLLLDENQRDAKLPLNGVAAISCILDLTTGQDGCIVVRAYFDLIQGQRFVLQVTRAMSGDPLLFG